MSIKFSDITSEHIDDSWLLTFLTIEFEKPQENITALKILAKLGIPIHDQSAQLSKKDIVRKLNSLLKVLKEKHVLEKKNSLHDTLGIKEIAYKFKTKG